MINQYLTVTVDDSLRLVLGTTILNRLVSDRECWSQAMLGASPQGGNYFTFSGPR